jgi:dimethylamine corrinoid protein
MTRGTVLGVCGAVGRAPVTEGFAAKIGADGYAPDASRAAALAKRLVGGSIQASRLSP